MALNADGRPDKTPRANPLVVEVGTPGSTIRLQGNDGSYLSDIAVPVSVGSTLPRWRISVTSSPIESDTGHILSPDRLFLQPEGRMGSNQSCIDLGGRQVLMAGGPTGPRMMDCGTIRIGAEIDPYTPAGLYRGAVRLDPESPGGPARGTTWEALYLQFEFEVVEMLAVDVLTDVVEFGSQTAGTFDCRAPAVIWVYSNHVESEVIVSLTNLSNPDNGSVLPAAATVIGWGDSPAAARNHALGRPFGANDLSITVGPGAHKIAIHARINLSTSMLAGDYSGRIEITSLVNH